MSNQYTKQQLISKKQLSDCYHKNMTYKEIAKKYNLSIKVIFNRMKEYKLKPRGDFRRPKEKYYRCNYVYVKDKNHPRRDGRDRVPEHIIIMENYLGRRLKYYGFNNKNNEVVHHINEIKTDNRIENLELMTNSEHQKFHQKKRRLEKIVSKILKEMLKDE